MQVLDEVNAVLKFSLMDLSKANLLMALPMVKDTAGALTAEDIGMIDKTKYAKNITMFALMSGGKYKKITLYNALNESNFSLATAPKADGAIELEVHAHWDPITGGDVALYKIEEVTTIA
jgi:hypothetical protein